MRLQAQKRSKIAQAELNRLLTLQEAYVAGNQGVRTHFRLTELDHLNLANRILDGIDFSGSSFVHATLNGASLVRSSLYFAVLCLCDLRYAVMRAVDLRGASLKGARLAHAVLDHADLRATTMTNIQPNVLSISGYAERVAANDDAQQDKIQNGVDFSNCSLKYVSFENARLDNVDFSDALLHGATFKGARLTNVTMRGAVLTGVDLRYLDVPPDVIAECVTDVTPIAAAKAATLKDKLDAHRLWITSNGMQGAAAVLDGEDLRPLWEQFAGRPLTGLSAKNAVAIGVDFYGCALQGAKFDGADLRDADFSTADLSGASFVGAKLGHARFDKAQMGNLRLLSGEILSPSLCDAQALPVQFRDTIMDDSLEALGLEALSES